MSDAQFGSWTVAESPVEIEYSQSVVEEIRHAVADGFQRLQRGGIEVGGVLYGTREDRRLRVLAMREISCEHARGPTFQLSDNDRVALMAQIARDKEDMRLEGQLVLGWFVSHTRSEVTLQQSDLDTYNTFFTEPWQVTFVVHPTRAGAMRAGFFVRETDNSVRGEHSYHEFDLPDRVTGATDRSLVDRRRSSPEPSAGQSPTPAETAPLEASASTQPGEKRPDRWDPQPRPSPKSEPPVLSQPPDDDLQFAHYPNTRRKVPWSIIGIVCVVAAIVGMGVAGLRFMAPQANAEPLSLGLVEQDGQLHIRWNHASQSIMSATGGVLEIVDGREKNSVPLNRGALEQGSFTYLRKTGEVQIRLAVQSGGGRRVEEQSLFLAAEPAAVNAKEFETLKLERDALEDDVTRLRGETAGQAAKIQQLQRTLVILQSRLGITDTP